MKSFFSSLFASVLGGIIVVFLFFFLLVGVAATSGDEDLVEISSDSYLHLNLNGKLIQERTDDSEFAELLSLVEDAPAAGLQSILRGIEQAASDESISGMVLESAVFMGGGSAAQEIRTALERFSDSGKPIYAYGTFFSARGLYLSSVADSLFLNPSGMMDWTGMSLGVSYYKGMLDKIGVEAQAIRGSNNQFKSAVEPFIQEEMSSSNRLQLETLAGDLWNEMKEAIAWSRDMDPTELQKLADELLLIDAQDVLAQGLCDRLLFEDQWLAFLEEKLGEDHEEQLVSLGDFLDARPTVGSRREKDRIATLFVNGEFTSGDGMETVDAQTMVNALQDIRENEHIKALIIRVNSPGGQAWIADQMVREIDKVKEQMPVIVSMSDVAASAGYMVACLGDTVFAQPNTITGSIGVFGLTFNAEQLLEEKMGIRTYHINTAEHADMGYPDRSLDAYERQVLQNAVDRYYGQFIDLVAEERGLSRSYVDSIGQGRVWSGSRALQLGLVDALGGMKEAEEAARSLAGLDSGSYRLKDYPEYEDPIEQLINDLTQARMPSAWTQLDPAISEAVEWYAKWKTLQGVPLMQMEQELHWKE
ncbi:MAG: signal peptide peptidase SppA [Flavobacteriia bacterium]|nr:signal peptide peptidase SppA [Flavobacteriia bacterium]